MPSSRHWKEMIDQLQSERLTVTERRAMRSVLMRTMGVSPATWPRRVWLRVTSAFTLKPLRPMTLMTTIGAIVLLLTGGVATAAESSLPGQPLFGFKTNVSEEVRAALTFSSEGQADWAIRRVERRMEEAESLAARGELNAKAQANIEANFERFANHVNSLIKKFSDRGQTDIAARLSSNLEAALSAHQQILTALASESNHSQSLTSTVNAAAKAATHSRTEHEAALSAQGQADVQAAAEGRIRATMNKIEEVEKFMTRLEGKLGAEATAEATAKLQLAKDTVAEGQAKVETDAYGEAFRLFQAAHRIAQQAKLLAIAAMRLNVHTGVGTNVNAVIPPIDPQPDHGQDSERVDIQTSTNASANVQIETRGGVTLPF